MASAARTIGRPAKGHVGRQRKAVCSCGMIVYASAAAYERCGLPTCGCGERMQLANLRDIALIEPARLEGLPEREFHAAMRELGHTDMIHAKQPPRHSRQPQCGEDGCSKFRANGERFCLEHTADALPF